MSDPTGLPDPPREPSLQPRVYPPGRKLAWYAAAGAAAVLAAIPLFFLRREEPSAGKTVWPSPIGDKPRADLPDRPSSEPSSRLYTAAADEMSLDEFMGTLTAAAPEPVAKRFTEAFTSNPVLRDTWRAYHVPGKTASATELMTALKAVPEFHQLVARFKSDPGFQSAWLKIQKDPRMAAVLRAEPPARAEGGLGASPAGGSSKTPGSPPGTQARVGVQSAPGAAGGFTNLGGHGATPDAVDARQPGNGASERAPGHEDARPPAGPQAHDVAAVLDSSWRSQGGSDPLPGFRKLFPWLASLSDTDLQSVWAQVSKGNGVWGGCFNAGIYQKCREACGSDPKGCTAKSGWDACLEGNGNSDAGCIAKCQQQPCCKIPDALWQPACGPTVSPSAAYCATGQGSDACAGQSLDRTGTTWFQCQTSGQYYNDGRCYAEKAGITCCLPGKTGMSGSCSQTGSQQQDWYSQACECTPNLRLANATAPFCP